MKKAVIFILLGLSSISLLVAQTNIRMMTYNLLNFTSSSSDRTPYFKTVIDNMNPDILIVQEMTSQSAVNLFYSQVLNPAFSAGTFIDGPDTDSEIYFKNYLFTFVSNHAIPTSLRNIYQFTLVFKETGDTIFIYSVHLKASTGTSNEAQRAAEVTILRNVTNSLADGKYFMVCGDFNIYKSTEQAYIKLIADNGINDGHFIDPFNMPGTWNNINYAPYHTQSTRTRQFGGGATGGMDDRFDLLLFSQAIADPGGMDYVNNTMWAVGNDGNHYNDSVNKQPNNSVSQLVANALHYASDHLPVIAGFSFEESATTNTIAFPLADGWNGVSSYLLPDNPNIQNIFSPLGNSFELVKTLTGVYWPQQGINTIQNWQNSTGYLIKVNTNTTLTFDGQLPLSRNLQIVNGWNLIPVLSPEPKIINTLFGQNINHIEIIKEAVGTLVYWPEQGIYTLQSLQPKKAYYLKSDQSFTISF